MVTEMLEDRRNITLTTSRYFFFAKLSYSLVPWTLSPHSEAAGALSATTEVPSQTLSVTSACGSSSNNFETTKSHLKTVGSAVQHMAGSAIPASVFKGP